jgi:predicted Rossmann fold flavoprotein
MEDLIVIGGGASGVFAAICAKTAHPLSKVTLLEKSSVLLAKVRVSGGGRCNVTHSCFEPASLVKNYPRGFRELLGPFHQFQPKQVVEWFESRGVALKTEADGRIFPVSNQSESIIDCLLQEARKLGVVLLLRQRIQQISKGEEGFKIDLADGEMWTRKLLLATGSSAEGHKWAESLGHTIQPPVPSLFTFNIPTSPLKELSGISVEKAELRIDRFSYQGPLLITHFGFSGPAALKLSAWGARYLKEKEYRVPLFINWLPDFSTEEIFKTLVQWKTIHSQKMLLNESPFQLPKNLWKALLGFQFQKKLNDVSHKDLQILAQKLSSDCYQVEGKTTNKEEFVTCGGVSLSEVHFKTMQSKLCPGLFFAGEVLDIDGITGGFNFQNAWTTGYLAGNGGMDTPPTG